MDNMTWEEAIKYMRLDNGPRLTRNRYLKIEKRDNEYRLMISTLDQWPWVDLMGSEHPEPVVAMYELLHHGWH